MTAYEYKVVPAPTRGEKARGVRGNEARFACALERLMNDMGAEGWEYQRAETLPSEERSGLTSTTRTYRNVLVFRRALNRAVGAAQPLILENPTQVPLRLTRPLPQVAHPEGVPHESPSLLEETRPDAPAPDLAPEPEAQPAPPADAATAPQETRPQALAPHLAQPSVSLRASAPQAALPDPAAFDADDEDDADDFVLRPRDVSGAQPEPEPLAARAPERPPEPVHAPRQAEPARQPKPQPPRAPRRTAALLDDNGVEGTEPVVGLGAALRARAARLRTQQDDVAAE